MDLINRKINALKDAGVTAEYMAELVQLINQDKELALKGFKSDFLNCLDIDRHNNNPGVRSKKDIINALELIPKPKE